MAASIMGKRDEEDWPVARQLDGVIVPAGGHVTAGRRTARIFRPDGGLWEAIAHIYVTD